MASFRTLDEFPADVDGSVAMVRVDFNVPMQDGRITDNTRLRAAIPTIRELQARHAAIVLMAHFGRPKGKVVPEMSLRPIVEPLSSLLGAKVKFCDDLDRPYLKTEDLKAGEVMLLENLRFKAGEETNDPEFVEVLARCGDYFINDAFSAAHRAHASTEGIAHKLPAYAGRAMQAELDALTKALETPERPVAAIVGGAKISTKLGLLANLLDKVDALIIGGGMANTFLAAEGRAMGKSLCETALLDTARDIMAKAKQKGREIVLPVDAVVARKFEAGAPSRTVGVDAIGAEDMMLDIGPKSVEHVLSAIGRMKTLVWNGPFGAFEIKPFDAGTVAVARAVAKLTSEGKIVSVAGGGDTVAALNAAGVSGQLTYVSTAGGAFLEWLEGKPLPGVEALRIK
jgi:phosphoglycerate kinase